jgi:hypothetical protein
MAVNIKGFALSRASDEWLARNADHPRFTVRLWRFGKLWQCPVTIDGRVTVQLPAQASPRRAIDRADTWIRHYETNGPETAEEAVARVLRRYPLTTRTRIGAIVSLLCSSSDQWIDGAVLSDWQYTEAEEEEIRQREKRKRTDDLQKHPEWFRELDNQQQANICTAANNEISRIPLPDDGAPVSWPPISSSAPILNVPDDIRDDWRELVIEAARLLVYRTAPSRLVESLPLSATPEDAESMASELREHGRRLLMRFEPQKEGVS